MTITYQIPHVPLLNQLNEPVTDGQPDENTRMNCVFASNAAIATAYLGKPFYGDQLKDSDPAYGQGYTGGASERNLVGTMAKLGITITRMPSPTQQGLVDIIHREVSAGHGVIITMPSQWNSAPTLAGASWNPRTYSGPSHVGLACGVGPGEIRVMNPWGGFWHDGSDSYWAARLLEGEVWVATMTTATSAIPTGWKDDGTTLTAPNGKTVVSGFRGYILANNWDATNVPIDDGEQRVEQVELFNTEHGAGHILRFHRAQLSWTAHEGVFLTYVGDEAKYLRAQHDALSGQVTALQQQVADLQKQLAAALAAAKPDPLKDEALDVVTRLKSLLGAL